MTETGEFTRILGEVRDGRDGAMERAFSVVYDELRRIADAQLAPGSRDRTLGVTALVHETFLRVAGAQSTDVECRVHFFSLAARAMKHILIDHARRRMADKRGGPALRISLDDGTSGELAASADLASAEILALKNALDELALIDERTARVVELRFFAGLEEKEIGTLLGVDERTVRRDWRKARAWLQTRLAE